MKKLLIVLFLMCLLTANQYSQSEKIETKVTNNSVSSEKINISKSNSWYNFEERFITTVIIITEMVFLILILGYSQKVKKNFRIDSSKEFKQKIKALREEKIRYSINENLSNQRKIINSIVMANKVKGKTITETAKELSVAKGEILLATKIQQLQSQLK